MKKLVSTVVVLGILLCSNTVLADEPEMQKLNFEDDVIEGDLMMPDAPLIETRNPEALNSLVKAREDFADVVRKTGDEL